MKRINMRIPVKRLILKGKWNGKGLPLSGLKIAQKHILHTRGLNQEVGT